MGTVQRFARAGAADLTSLGGSEEVRAGAVALGKGPPLPGGECGAEPQPPLQQRGGEEAAGAAGRDPMDQPAAGAGSGQQAVEMAIAQVLEDAHHFHKYGLAAYGWPMHVWSTRRKGEARPPADPAHLAWGSRLPVRGPQHACRRQQQQCVGLWVRGLLVQKKHESNRGLMRQVGHCPAGLTGAIACRLDLDPVTSRAPPPPPP